MRILIVDDNPTNIIIIREILKKEKYRNTVSVSSTKEMFERLGVRSLERIEECGPSDIDLILLDMMMPDMDGLEACRLLQRSEHLKEIPIIMVTAIGDSNKLAEALDAGANDFVTKPINKVELMARIRTALRLKLEKDWHRNRDQRIQEELKLAALVQNAVLSTPIHDQHVEIDAIYKPSNELAGDLYAWYSLGEGRYGVILLDMMGHGISSYTDGLTDAQRGTLEERQAWLEHSLKGSGHRFNREEMNRMFFDEGLPREREDDKCLVWIYLK